MSLKPPVVIDLKFSRAAMQAALAGAFPDREVIDLGDPENADRDLSAAAYAVLWKPEPSLFTRASGLKVLFSGGAGVDHVLTLPGLPDLPIVRFVDRSLTDRMSEWVLLNCLYHLRHMSQYLRQQREKVWSEIDLQPEARDVTVGVMGLGVLGQDAARKLKVMGFDVIGWSRRRREIDGIDTYDEARIDEFLARTDILVGLLPLTPETRGLYDSSLFSRLRQGGALGKPVFLNAGRGGSQVEADVIAALQKGVLGAASLDVFEKEPLAMDSPLWAMENVVVTPHAAAASDVRALFAHVETQIARFEAGEALEHVVDRSAGY
ncbi:glyoxylate/hydroxypyruvate reductase A [Agrobacterium vitis]|uniref:2-hydroxyacid dehydrogenase n=1 Tax=Rhizobium/Agrobacterium group TaxID=227290 RepID=UPI0012E98C55|nr:MULTISPECIES: glyoxylate/hydroxypyruvate reductase A [Rhizobium/Agrobacterium group]MCF1435698.1 glyoxylate/hydroxypyruvate reductase A [Allorhizobium ampelinum]MUO90296.1 glyoxylate/hydroxypyruvate reductase A [Agrobacterium vitis]MUZ52307.1 glyoxylate/hydroxypyruvate reductase A [Agrobacterium vitis]MUZ91643.1 glyoxylate/hydroxypyruvate reductase A [Agrobacterium vitis]MVA39731.1 glyoxylate/hydroxypyruvate reductase A [Agrobacterium vitis]